jgi:HlyD family secretion protein
MKQIGWIGLSILALSVVTTGCVDRDAQAQAKKLQELQSDKSIPVETMPVSVIDQDQSVDITGQIVAGEDSQVGARVGGRLVSVLVKEGDFVRAGQTLAQVETRDVTPRVRQAQSRVSAARAQLNQAISQASETPTKSTARVESARARLLQARANLEKLRKGARDEERRQSKAAVAAAQTALEVSRREMERDKELLEQGAIAQREADRSRAEYAAALANYENALEGQRILDNGARKEDLVTAEQEVKAAEQGLRIEQSNKKQDVEANLAVQSARANLESAEEEYNLAQIALADTTITAPFSGRIAGRPLQVGTVVGIGTPVARLISSGGAYFEGDVVEQYLDRVQPGTELTVFLKGAGQDGIPGRVISVNPLATNTGRIFKTRVELLSGQELARPGMFATGRMISGTVTDVSPVPTGSVLGSPGKKFVYVADGNKAKRKAVVVKFEKSGMAYVSGLQPSDQLVVRGQDKLAEGAAISVAASAKDGA